MQPNAHIEQGTFLAEVRLNPCYPTEIPALRRMTPILIGYSAFVPKGNPILSYLDYKRYFSGAWPFIRIFCFINAVNIIRFLRSHLWICAMPLLRCC